MLVMFVILSYYNFMLIENKKFDVFELTSTVFGCIILNRIFYFLFNNYSPKAE